MCSAPAHVCITSLSTVVQYLPPSPLLGGSPGVAEVSDGAFTSGFAGCVGEVSVGPSSAPSLLQLDSATIGLSVTQCT